MSRREPGKHGLFEFVIVLIVVAVLGAAIARYVTQIIDAAWAASIETQAQQFAKIVGLMHWSWKQQGVNFRPAQGNRASGVVVDGALVYVNRFGWPTHVDPEDSRKPLQAKGCLDVWNVVMQKPGDVIAVTGAWRDDKALQVQAVDNKVCRFVLNSRGSGVHYFDYHVESGEVAVFVNAN